MTTPVNSTTPLTRLNIFDDPVPWNQVRVAGILVLALLTEVNGVKIEDEWKKQKSKNSSGAAFAFGGTNPVGGEGGFTLTFRATGREEFDQLYDIFDALKPVPGLGGGGTGTSSSSSSSPGSKWKNGTPVGSPAKPTDASAEDLLKQAQNALDSLGKPTPAASSDDPATAQKAATTPQPDPGPRPPTVPIELGWLAFVGVFAVARKSWEWSKVAPDINEVTIGFVHDNPPKPAGAGAMSAPVTPGSQYFDTARKDAKKGAAGT